MTLGADGPRARKPGPPPGSRRPEVLPLPKLVLPPRRDGAPSLAGPWRYADALPLGAPAPRPVSLGEGRGGIEALAIGGMPRGVLALREDRNPSGSWMDRGSSLLVSRLREDGVREVIESASRNAGLSLTRYGRAAGLRVRVFLPAASSAREKELIESEGATVIEVPGPRSACEDAAREAAARGAHWAPYAAHVWHALGAATAAFDIHAALGRMPRLVALPLGHGSLLAGLALGFDALARRDSEAPPALVGVQSARCAPLRDAFLEQPQGGATSASAKMGGLLGDCLVADPLRGREALDAVRATGGWIDAVDDLPIERALRLLWLAGFKVEAGAALPVAWLLREAVHRDLRVLDDTVVLLGGAGLRRGRPLFDPGGLGS